MDVGHEVCAVARRADHHLPCRVIVAERPLDATSYAAAAAQVGSEIVINLLAAGVEPADRDVDRLLAANAEFPARLASVLPQAGVKAMIHMGSSAGVRCFSRRHASSRNCAARTKSALWSNQGRRLDTRTDNGKSCRVARARVASV